MRKLELARRWWNGKEVYDPVHNNTFSSFSFCLNAAIYICPPFSQITVLWTDAFETPFMCSLIISSRSIRFKITFEQCSPKSKVILLNIILCFVVYFKVFESLSYGRVIFRHKKIFSSHQTFRPLVIKLTIKACFCCIPVFGLAVFSICLLCYRQSGSPS